MIEAVLETAVSDESGDVRATVRLGGADENDGEEDELPPQPATATVKRAAATHASRRGRFAVGWVDVMVGASISVRRESESSGPGAISVPANSSRGERAPRGEEELCLDPTEPRRSVTKSAREFATLWLANPVEFFALVLRVDVA